MESSESKVIKKKRGINNETRATSIRRFTEKDANTVTGLFAACIKEINVTIVNLKEGNNSMPSFNGYEIPRLDIHFTSLHNVETDRRHVFLTLFPVESTVDTIIGGKDEWKINTNFAWMKHILDVFVLKGKTLTEEQEDMLSLDYDDTDDDGNYINIDGDIILKAWKKVFEGFKSIMEQPKPCYLDDKGNPIQTWVKMTRFTKNKKTGWESTCVGSSKGELGFRFVGDGAFELIVPNKQPSLYLNPTKEAIRPMDVKKEPSMPSIPGMPSMDNSIGGMSPMGGMPMPPMSSMPEIDPINNEGTPF